MRPMADEQAAVATPQTTPTVAAQAAAPAPVQQPLPMAQPQQVEVQVQASAPSPVTAFSEFTIPEGMKFSEEFQNDYIKAINDPDPRARGQAVFDLNRRHAESLEDAAKVAASKRNDEWLTEVKAHPEYGGAKFHETQAMIDKALVQLDPEEKLQSLLRTTGLGNNPVVYDFMVQVSKIVTEPSFVAAQNSASRDSGTIIDRFARMYNKAA